MSVVLVTAMNNFALLMSDGRVVNGNRVIKEDYKKLRRVNKNICVGFAGDQFSCEETLSVLSDSMTFSLIADSLYKKAQEVNRKRKERILICIIGFSEQGIMELKHFNSDDFILHSDSPKNGLAFISLEPTPTNTYLEIMEQSQKTCFNDYCIAMQKTIIEISKKNHCVNNFIFSELITNDLLFYGRS